MLSMQSLVKSSEAHTNVPPEAQKKTGPPRCSTNADGLPAKLRFVIRAYGSCKPTVLLPLTQPESPSDLSPCNEPLHTQTQTKTTSAFFKLFWVQDRVVKTADTRKPCSQIHKYLITFTGIGEAALLSSAEGQKWEPGRLPASVTTISPALSACFSTRTADGVSARYSMFRTSHNVKRVATHSP